MFVSPSSSALSIATVMAGAAPATPASFVGVPNYNQINFAWDEPANTDEYDLERSAAGAGSWSVVANFAAPATTYDLTVTAVNTQYDYRLIAKNASGSSTPSSTVTRWTPKIYDAFDGADNTELTSHTADIGVAWTRLDLTATTGRVELDGAGRAVYEDYETGGAKIYYQTGLADGVTRVLIRKIDTVDVGSWGIAFRVQNASNFLFCVVNLGTNQLQLWRRVSGGYTNVANLSVALTHSENYDVLLSRVGTAIEASVNGGTVLSTTITHHATQVGVGIVNSTSDINMAWLQIVDTQEAG